MDEQQSPKVQIREWHFKELQVLRYVSKVSVQTDEDCIAIWGNLYHGEPLEALHDDSEALLDLAHAIIAAATQLRRWKKEGTLHIPFAKI